MWQDSEKYLFAVMPIGAFVFVLVAAQPAQTSELHAYSEPPAYFTLRNFPTFPHIPTPLAYSGPKSSVLSIGEGQF